MRLSGRLTHERSKCYFLRLSNLLEHLHLLSPASTVGKHLESGWQRRQSSVLISGDPIWPSAHSVIALVRIELCASASFVRPCLHTEESGRLESLCITENIFVVAVQADSTTSMPPTFCLQIALVTPRVSMSWGRSRIRDTSILCEGRSTFMAFRFLLITIHSYRCACDIFWWGSSTPYILRARNSC